MLKICNLGDLHLKGSDFDRCKLGLGLIKEKLIELKIDLLIIHGDIFDKYNIADRYKTTGELQGLLIEFLLLGTDFEIIINPGNHDMLGNQKSALEFLKIYDRVKLIEKPDVIVKDNVSIGILPWIEKGTYYSKFCKGLSKTESEQKFTEEIHKVLGFFKSEFECDMDHKLLFGHVDIAGTKVNKSYIVSGVGFSFNKSHIEATGCDYFSFSHIHKRGGGYVGSPWQQNFGEEGNPQGIEIITIDGKDRNIEYIKIDMPEFKTIIINNVEDVASLAFNVEWNYKLRFNSEEAYNLFIEKFNQENVIIEKLYTKQKHVLRTDKEVTATMSDDDLLDEFIKINKIPVGITEKEIKEIANL